MVAAILVIGFGISSAGMNVPGPKDDAPRTEGNLACSLSAKGAYLVVLSDRGKITVWNTKLRQPVVSCHAERTMPKGYTGFRYGYTEAFTVCFDARDEQKVWFCNGSLYVWERKKNRSA
jgi:hypothetical protein